MMKKYFLFTAALISTAINVCAQWQPTFGPGFNTSFSKLIDGKIFTSEYISTDHGQSFHLYGDSSVFHDVIKHQGKYYGRGAGLYSSVDGETWDSIGTIGANLLYSDGTSLYCYAPGVRKSPDNGLTWTVLFDTTIFPHNFFVFGSKYIISTWDGIFSSEIGSGIWDRRTYDVVEKLSTAGDHLILSDDNRFYTIDTVTWTMTEAMSGMSLATQNHASDFEKHSGNIYASTPSGIYYADENTLSWQLLSSMVTLVLDVDPPYIFGRNLAGLQISSDMGSSWSMVNNGIHVNTNIISCAANDSRLYVANGYHLYRKPIFSNQWEEIILPYTDCDDISVYNDTLITVLYGNVYFSYDEGASWMVQSSGMTSATTGAVIKHKNKYFCPTAAGVYRSELSPVTWTLLPSTAYSATLLANSTALVTTNFANSKVSFDAGNTWSILPDIFSCSAITEQFLATYGNDTLYYTSDYSNWTKVHNPLFHNGINMCILDSSIYFDGMNYGAYGSHYNYGLYQYDIASASLTTFQNGLLGDSLVWPIYQELSTLYALNGNLYAGVTNGEFFEIINGSPPVGIAEQESEDDLILYPNPASSNIFIRSGNKITGADLYDLNGSLLNKATGNTIDVSFLSSGIYFLKCYTKEGIIMKKFIKQ
jgi:hypothetical protein